MIRSNINVRLNLGTRDNGSMIVRSISMRNLWADADIAKIWAVIVPLAPLLAYPVFRTERHTVTAIEP
jgi:hypothetical protein